MLNNSKSSRMMPGTSNSSVKPDHLKPMNVFYVWYTELCRRSSINPIVITKVGKSKCNTVLDFAVDRLKLDDWSPLINALRHDTSLHVINIKNRMANYEFLHDVDTEDKARLTKRKYGLIWTDYVLNSLVEALSYSLKKTQVLTCLELDGLPMFKLYLEVLLKALKENNTLKILSLANCAIQDEGCRSVCLCLQLIPNIESLNLSRCDLTSVSGKYIAKLIKYQQLNRYTASWHKSLRYAEPDSETMRGIRRITLNGNTRLGDVGLECILDELEDDLWIKALDLQLCGITENIASKLLDVLTHNQSIQIADFRLNKDLNPLTHEKVFEVLKAKASNNDSSLHWCSTLLSLCSSTNPSTSRGNSSSLSNRTSVLPRKKVNGIVKDSKNGIVNVSRPKSTAVNIMNRKINGCVEEKISKKSAQGKCIHINFEMNHEVVRREFRNPNDKICKRPTTVKQVNGINGIYGINEVNGVGKRVMSSLKNLQVTKERPINTVNDSSMKKINSSKCSKGINVFINGLTNGYRIVQNQKISVTNTASNIFQKLFGGTDGKETADSSSDEEGLRSFCENYEIDLSEIRKNSSQYLQKTEISSSQISLYKFMEEYDDPKIFPSNYHFKGMKNGIK